jgi:hypothetical protein
MDMFGRREYRSSAGRERLERREELERWTKRENELIRAKDKATEETRLICDIFFNILYLDKAGQRRMGEHFRRYVEQNDLPNVRNVVKALLDLES